MTIWERWERAMLKVTDPALRGALQDIFFDHASIRVAARNHPGVNRGTIYRRLLRMRKDVGELPESQISLEIDLLEKRLVDDVHKTIKKIRKAVVAND